MSDRRITVWLRGTALASALTFPAGAAGLGVITAFGTPPGHLGALAASIAFVAVGAIAAIGMIRSRITVDDGVSIRNPVGQFHLAPGELASVQARQVLKADRSHRSQLIIECHDGRSIAVAASATRRPDEIERLVDAILTIAPTVDLDVDLALFPRRGSRRAGTGGFHTPPRQRARVAPPAKPPTTDERRRAQHAQTQAGLDELRRHLDAIQAGKRS